MSEPRAAIFDVDGTLLDSREFIYQAFEHVLLRHGLAPRTREEMMAVVGLPLGECYLRLAPAAGPGAADLSESHKLFQLGNLDLAPAFTGIREALAELQRHAFGLAAATTRSSQTSITTLELAGLREYFQVVVSGEDTVRPKPDPEPLLLATQRLEVEPRSAVMIGDTAVDIIAGRRAGMRTIGVSYGFHGAAIADAHPDLLVGHPSEIIEAVLAMLP